MDKVTIQKELTDNIFCPEDCEFLSPNEEDQKQIKSVHYCAKYDCRLFHFKHHPKICRCTACKSPSPSITAERLAEILEEINNTLLSQQYSRLYFKVLATELLKRLRIVEKE